MKMLLTALFITAALSFTTLYVFGQDKNPGWLPEKGYWVIESALNNPKHAIVHFYNDENTEVYKEEINGYGAKLERRKYRMQLKKMLDKAMNAWAMQKPLPANEGFFIALLQKK
ncbi:MAG: hypothetical protein WDO19_30095 [Bacteroidota bacterium]